MCFYHFETAPFSLRHADQREDFLREEHHNAASQSEKSLASLGGIVTLDRPPHLLFTHCAFF